MNKIAFVGWCLTSAVALGQSASDYKEFQKSLETTISQSREVASTPQEQADLRILEWKRNELKGHIAKKDWASASSLMQRLQPSLQRGSAVAADAPRRKAAQERADRERRHREIMAQSDRQHQQLMNEMRNRSYAPVYAPSQATYAPISPPRTTTIRRP